MSNPLMEKMLDLPEFEVTDFKQNDNDMGFYFETKLLLKGLTVSFALYPMKDVAMISTFSVVRYFCQRDEKSKPRK